jgi:hypothetical protein
MGHGIGYIKPGDRKMIEKRNKFNKTEEVQNDSKTN